MRRAPARTAIVGGSATPQTRLSSPRSRPAEVSGGRAGRILGRRQADREPCRPRKWSTSAAPKERSPTGRPRPPGRACWSPTARSQSRTRRRNHGRADRRPVSGRRVRVVGDVLTVGAVTQMVDGRTGFGHSAHRATARTAFLLTGNGSGDRRCPVPTLPVFRTPAARREDLSGHPRSLRLPLPWMREHQQGSPGFSGVPSRQRDPRDRRHPPLQR